MKVISVHHVQSAVRSEQYPPEYKGDIVFLGRSNVGKSTCINALTKRKSLAYVSSRPGKTQTLNFFLINEQFYLVDAPGYGYASREKAHKKQFEAMMETYFTARTSLRGACLLLDVRRQPGAMDEQMIAYLRFYKLPFFCIITKCDKLSQTQVTNQAVKIQKALQIESRDTFVYFSSKKKCDILNAWQKIEILLNKGATP